MPSEIERITERLGGVAPFDYWREVENGQWDHLHVICFMRQATTANVKRMETGEWRGIERGTPDFRRTVAAMLCAGFATFALIYCVQPLLPEFARDFDIDAASATLAVSLTTGFMGLAMLGISVLSERRGRRSLMISSMLFAAALTVASAFVRSWVLFLILRAAIGIGFAGLPALAMAYLGEEMHLGALAVAMGLYVGGTGIGGMTGRLLTAFLTDLVSWRFAVVTIGLLGVGAALVFWRLLPPSRRFVPARLDRLTRWSGFGAHLRDATMLRLYATGFAVLGVLVVLYNDVTFRLMGAPYHLSQSAVGLIFLLYLAGVGSSGWVGHLLGRVGRSMLLRVCLLVMILGAAVTLAGALPIIVIGIALVTIGFFGAHAIASGWVTAHARRGRAQATALYLCFYYIGSSIAGWAGGLAWDVAGWVGTVTLMVALSGMALVLTWGMPEG
jgi:MFS transporter, YNFM family, putative membrane transport protein